MKSKQYIGLGILFIVVFLTACSPFSDQLIANRYAEAVLTKNNELEFRFKINDQLLQAEQPYKVKVSIHNQELAAALGTEEIIYGDDIVFSGEYLEADKNGHQMIYMTPVALRKDLHPFELAKMIGSEKAISVEVYNDKEVLGKAYLTNFTTQL